MENVAFLNAFDLLASVVEENRNSAQSEILKVIDESFVPMKAKIEESDIPPYVGKEEKLGQKLFSLHGKKINLLNAEQIFVIHYAIGKLFFLLFSSNPLSKEQSFVLLTKIFSSYGKYVDAGNLIHSWINLRDDNFPREEKNIGQILAASLLSRTAGMLARLDSNTLNKFLDTLPGSSGTLRCFIVEQIVKDDLITGVADPFYKKMKGILKDADPQDKNVATCRLQLEAAESILRKAALSAIKNKDVEIENKNSALAFSTIQRWVPELKLGNKISLQRLCSILEAMLFVASFSKLTTLVTSVITSFIDEVLPTGGVVTDEAAAVALQFMAVRYVEESDTMIPLFTLLKESSLFSELTRQEEATRKSQIMSELSGNQTSRFYSLAEQVRSFINEETFETKKTAGQLVLLEHVTTGTATAKIRSQLNSPNFEFLEEIISKPLTTKAFTWIQEFCMVRALALVKHKALDETTLPLSCVSRFLSFPILNDEASGPPELLLMPAPKKASRKATKAVACFSNSSEPCLLCKNLLVCNSNWKPTEANPGHSKEKDEEQGESEDNIEIAGESKKFVWNLTCHWLKTIFERTTKILNLMKPFKRRKRAAQIEERNFALAHVCEGFISVFNLNDADVSSLEDNSGKLEQFNELLQYLSNFGKENKLIDLSMGIFGNSLLRISMMVESMVGCISTDKMIDTYLPEIMAAVAKPKRQDQFEDDDEFDEFEEVDTDSGNESDDIDMEPLLAAAAKARKEDDEHEEVQESGGKSTDDETPQDDDDEEEKEDDTKLEEISLEKAVNILAEETEGVPWKDKKKRTNRSSKGHDIIKNIHSLNKMVEFLGHFIEGVQRSSQSEDHPAKTLEVIVAILATSVMALSRVVTKSAVYGTNSVRGTEIFRCSKTFAFKARGVALSARRLAKRLLGKLSGEEEESFEFSDKVAKDALEDALTLWRKNRFHKNWKSIISGSNYNEIAGLCFFTQVELQRKFPPPGLRVPLEIPLKKVLESWADNYFTIEIRFVNQILDELQVPNRELIPFLSKKSPFVAKESLKIWTDRAKKEYKRISKEMFEEGIPEIEEVFPIALEMSVSCPVWTTRSLAVQTVEFCAKMTTEKSFLKLCTDKFIANLKELRKVRWTSTAGRSSANRCFELLKNLEKCLPQENGVFQKMVTEGSDAETSVTEHEG
eukprot:GHVP01024980.1.p1 GENE.GHVP01024980.1~~GHVP01024980.1.p1  ORF type:complete len:1174 (+),score=294.76 GHVP01024980.1:1150-4671(+)